MIDSYEYTDHTPNLLITHKNINKYQTLNSTCVVSVCGKRVWLAMLYDALNPFFIW